MDIRFSQSEAERFESDMFEAVTEECGSDSGTAEAISRIMIKFNLKEDPRVSELRDILIKARKIDEGQIETNHQINMLIKEIISIF